MPTPNKIEQQPTCKQRWASHKASRCGDLRRLWRAYQEGEDSAYAKRISADLGEFHEYGLAFDYVAPGTFNDQREGYWRYQISWGGPRRNSVSIRLVPRCARTALNSGS